MSEAPSKKMLWRLTPFRAGLLAGVAAGVAMVAAVNIRPAQVGPTAELVTSGATLSAAGVRTVEFVSTYRPVRALQTCVDECDDLTFVSRDSGGGKLSFRIKDKTGRCIDCERDFPVDAPAGGVTRLDLGAPGAPSAPLVRVGNYKINPDGSRTLIPPPAQ